MKFIASLQRHWVAWVWNHTPSCAEMSRLASMAFEQPPSFATRLRMRLHNMICIWCERYQRQLRFLHRTAPRLGEELENVSAHRLSKDARMRMVQRLHQAAHR